ncbi:NAD(P)-dependent oxidoreductase [Schumannella luteola]|uniref:dTDP-6-deoxy-L-talose 4-dehydrogenase (NAD+) n=1 Tax=Schumannella luteola TaxID=472059 RepID=A0A852YI13_9MICO|nr:NAD(P)-dependent oxidoreductase [Schumannella luteola]NYG98728.1 dTDP-6-deoxy-L-talose 4-dehydrogenase (NAD+) [Schumannella luteola]TPX04312.1 NAD(P)-dependent oxidoreductase [Schumannella luteola]
MSDQSNLPVLVTGAAGYVGRHVVTALLDLGYDAVAVTRPGRADGVDPRARRVEADILAPGFEVSALLEQSGGAAAVIHLAWQDGFTHNAPSHIDNIPAHHRFLTGLAAAGVPRIAGLGTMHEVGYWEGAIDADTPTAPTSLYGIAKDALRRSTTLVIGDSAEYVWLRAYYILGDDRRNRSIFAKLLEAADEGKTEFPFTTGKSKYDFIDVAELGRQIAIASTTAGATGVINVSSGEPVSLADRVEQFIRDNELGITLQYGAFPDRPYDSPAVWGDATRIREILAAREH